VDKGIKECPPSPMEYSLSQYALVDSTTGFEDRPHECNLSSTFSSCVSLGNNFSFIGSVFFSDSLPNSWFSILNNKICLKYAYGEGIMNGTCCYSDLTVYLEQTSNLSLEDIKQTLIS
jgi:hypothetical protein